MRLLPGTLLLGLAISAFPASAPAQSSGAVGLYSGPNSVYGAPGNYGTTYGVPSYGMRRTYSAFPSPYGGGYGYGYAPTSFLPGPYGAGLWRPGSSAPAYAYVSDQSYRTFPVREWPVPRSFGPPIGAYAPHLGPPAVPTW